LPACSRILTVLSGDEMVSIAAAFPSTNLRGRDNWGLQVAAKRRRCARHAPNPAF
jgi:hypothetical protein